MKIVGRIILVLMVALSFGCQTTQGQSGGTASPTATPTASPAASSAPSFKMLNEADYKRIGVRETEDLR